MDKVFITILNMSLTGAFVITAICLARLPLKKAPKVISYCLWAVAGFRLVFPFSIESVLSLIPFNARTIPTDIATQAVPRINSGITVLNNTVSRVLPAAAPGASVNPLQIWTTVGAVIWLAGAAAMLLYGAASFILLKRKMKAAVCAEANVYEAQNIKSPFVLGFFKPRIYLPAGLTEREYVLLHERTHIRRRDHIVKLAAYVVLCLHWFNPLAWLAFLLMGADMEMSCDERVLKEAGGKVDYSLSLLSLSTERRSIAGSPLAFGEGGVKERVKNVLKFKKHSRIIIILAVALAAALGVGFAVSRAVRAESNLTPENAFDLLKTYLPAEITDNMPDFREEQEADGSVLYVWSAPHDTDAQYAKHLIEMRQNNGSLLFYRYKDESLQALREVNIPIHQALEMVKGYAEDFLADGEKLVFSTGFYSMYLPGTHWVASRGDTKYTVMVNTTYGYIESFAAKKMRPEQVAANTVWEEYPNAEDVHYSRFEQITVNGHEIEAYIFDLLLPDGSLSLCAVTKNDGLLLVQNDGEWSAPQESALFEMTITDEENPAFWFTEMKLNWGDRVYHVASMRDPQRGREIGYARDEVSEWRIYEIEGYSRDEYLLAVESEDVWRVMSVYPPEEPVKQYILENATRKQQMERLLSVSLYADGTARLATPPISSYSLLSPYYYMFEDDELMIHYERDDVIARFTVIDENTIVFKESSAVLFAEEGARYVTFAPAAYEPRKWLDYYYDEQMPWDGGEEITLPEFPDVTFKWTSGTVTAITGGKERELFMGMPVWSVYFADINGDALPEICATVSFGSGMVDDRVIVYDIANDTGYFLNDRGYYDYTLSLENGRLLVTQTLHSERGLEERQAVSGELAIQNGELVAIGIDRTITEIPQNIEPSSPPNDISVAESDDDSPGNDFGRKTTVTVRLEDGSETPFVYLGNWNTQIFSEDLFRDGSTALVVLLTNKTSNYLSSQIHVLKTDGTTVEEVFTVVDGGFDTDTYEKTLFAVPQPNDDFGYTNPYGYSGSSTHCTGVQIITIGFGGQNINALLIDHSTKVPAYSVVYFDGSEWKLFKQGSDVNALTIKAGEGGIIESTIPADVIIMTFREYPEGTKVTIQAKAEAGFRFSHWTSSKGNAVFTDADKPTTVFFMPGEDTVVTAHFEPLDDNPV